MRSEKRQAGADAALAVTLLTLCHVLSYVDRTAIAAFLPQIKREFGVSDAELGLLSGLAFSASYALCGLWVARRADRGNRRNIVGVALVVWSAMTAACGAAGSFLVLLLARIGVGVGESGCVPPAHSMFADMFPLRRRVLVLSIYSAGQPLGSLIGLAVGGYLAHVLGWRDAFYIFGLAGLALAPLLFLGVREPPRSIVAGPREKGALARDLKLLFERRSYACLLAGLGFAGFAVSAFAAWLPTYYDRTFGLGMAEIGVAFGLAYGLGSTAGILVGGVVATPLVARDVRWALLIPVFGYVLAAPLLLFALFTASFPFAMGLLFAGFAILTSGFGAVYALVQTVAPAPLRSLAVALAILASNLIGAGIGPLIVGAVSDVAGAYGAGNPLQIGLLAALLFYPFPPLFYLAGTRYVAADAA